VHNVKIITETLLLIAFFIAFLTDMLVIELNNIFSIVFILSMFGALLLLWLVKDWHREHFFNKIDVYSFKHEEEAMQMLI